MNQENYILLLYIFEIWYVSYPYSTSQFGVGVFKSPRDTWLVVSMWDTQF